MGAESSLSCGPIFTVIVNAIKHSLWQQIFCAEEYVFLRHTSFHYVESIRLFFI